MFLSADVLQMQAACRKKCPPEAQLQYILIHQCSRLNQSPFSLALPFPTM